MATREKTGGRAKGTPNKTTAETKEMLQKIVSKEIENLGELLGKLEPIDRVNVIAKLLPYMVPKQSEVSLIEPEPPRKIIIKLPKREIEATQN